MFENQLNSIPSEPPRSAKLLPGLSLRSAISRGSLLFPLAFVVFFSMMPLIFAFEDPNARLALGHVETVEAKVLDVARDATCKGSCADVTYAFSPLGGPEYRATRSVCPRSAYFTIRPGETVPVKYLVSDPSFSAIAGETSTNPGFYAGFLMFPAFALVFFVPLLLPQFRRVVRDRSLFRNGRITRGTVVFVKPSAGWTWPGWPGSSASEVFIQYQLPSGATAEASAQCQSDWLLRHIAPGTTVHIAYLPSRPSRAILLDAYVR